MRECAATGNIYGFLDELLKCRDDVARILRDVKG
jgi:hypothetical protein